MRFSRSVMFAGLLGLGICAVAAQAQEYPAKQISVVLGVGAGGATDSIARLVAQKMSEKMGVPILVENRVGAAQMIAIDYTKRAAPDGYTFFFAAGSALGQVPGIRKDLSYDPLKDFTYVAMTATTPGVLVVRSGFPASNVRELVELARKSPGKLNYGSSGLGTAGHLQMEYFMSKTGTDMVHIPFKSDNLLAIELAEGRLDTAILTAQFGLPIAQSGRVKLLAVTSTKSLSYAPGTPNLREIGIAGLDGLDPLTFSGFLGPAGVSPEIVRRFNRVHNEVTAMPDIGTRFRDGLRSEPVSESPEAFRKFVEAELVKWTAIGRGLKVQLQ
jgi:tripartite-type tricarboxylate transporter receptor subunit TctC